MAGLVFGFPFLSFVFPGSPFLTALGITNVLVVLGIPLVSMVFLVTRILFRTRLNRYWKWGMWGFWLLNMISLGFVASFAARQFQVSHTSEPQTIRSIATDTLLLQGGHYPYEEVWLRFGEDIRIVDGTLVSRDIRIYLEKGTGDAIQVVRENYSRGRQLDEAIELTRQLDYQPTMSDNVLTFPPFFTLEKGEKWAGQHITFRIRIPEGKFLSIGPAVLPFIVAADKDQSTDPPRLSTGQVWEMGPGGLVLPGAEPIGQNTSSEFPVSSFHEVLVSGKLKVYLEQGEPSSVRLTGHETAPDAVRISQEASLLTIEANLPTNRPPARLYIKTPALSKLELHGTDDIKVSGFNEPYLRLENLGDNEVKLLADIGELELNLSGKSQLEVSGNGNVLKAMLQDQANLDAGSFQVKKAFVNSSGEQHQLSLAVSDSLFRDISEQTRLNLKGQPVLVGEPGK